MTIRNCKEWWLERIDGGDVQLMGHPHIKTIVAFVNGAWIEWVDEDSGGWATSQPPQHLGFASYISYRVKDERIN